MKSAFELAMERLNKSAPSKALTPQQKAELAEIDSLYKSRLAQLELRTQDSLTAAEAAGDFEKTETLRARFQQEKAQLESEREAKKDRVRKV